MGLTVQGFWSADDVSQDQDAYLTVRCIACNQTHLIGPATGKILGMDDNDD